MEEKELKELIVVEGMLEAEVIKSKLSAFEIPCILKTETIGKLIGATLNGLAKVKIMVREPDLEKARETIAVKE